MTIETLTNQLIELYDKVSSWEHSVVKDSGLSPAQMHTIEVIGHRKNLRMKELAEKLGVTTGTLTIGVDNLEKLGLVARKPHTTDRRSFFVVLTTEGKRIFAEHHRFHEDFTREISVELDNHEVEALCGLLGKVLDKM
ncbi:MarR family winged helix-turn-helix transcriptional regulator [Desulforhopalus singaporensis]|uniref:DNA-binding transcriptional regulator, MarR family n=1 Tax=Desulforhopalus singaporensis TaxID=91360 RepID=A0A1H0Q7U4_9BACT|nr:MarR family winged helix-turn-helix transcriptional regulator [Desulforhopalus singaporensis]SDP12699.1 DNA-binding transcriptional regulator, MarR family [Desulforhopalus singaporensis]